MKTAEDEATMQTTGEFTIRGKIIIEEDYDLEEEFDFNKYFKPECGQETFPISMAER